MWQVFQKISKGGLVDLSIWAAMVACALTAPPTVREAFAGSAITAAFMVASNAAWRLHRERKPG